MKRNCTSKLAGEIPKWEVVELEVPYSSHSLGDDCLGYQGKLFTQSRFTVALHKEHPKGVSGEAENREVPG